MRLFRVWSFCFALGGVVAACSNSRENVNRTGPPGTSYDSGTTLPEATTTGQTTTVVLADGATVQVTVQPDGALLLPDSGAILLEGGLGNLGGVFTLKCDTGSIVVSGAPKTVACAVLLQDGSPAQNVVWITQDTVVGSIGADGIFRANGWVGGIADIIAKIGNAEIKTQITVDFVLQENPDGVTSGDMAKLVSGGSADGGFRWLYPYDKTIFPRGLQPPLLQFGGTAADATYLKIIAPHFLYERYSGPSNPTRITIPPEVWKGLTNTAGPSDWVKASVTKLSAGSATGPVQEEWLIAQGKLKGILYYNSYNSPLAAGGGVLRMKLGQNAEALLSGCHVCHSVNANGTILTVGIEYGGAPTDGASYRLDRNGTATQLTYANDGTLFAFPAITPDGKFAVTAGSRTVRMGSNATTRLIDPETGTVLPAPSLTGVVTDAWMPVFSPDGSTLAFVDGNISYGKDLATMSFDESQNPPVFSNFKVVLNVSTNLIAWPSFLPDALGIAYHHGGSFTTERDTAELRLLDTSSSQVNTLAALNGYLPDGSFYLPYGMAEDGQVDYEPSALPIAIGGYYWLMFSSRRAYGNLIAPGGTVANGGTRFAKGGPRKKFWMSAIDIDYPNKSDPSHPAFYMEGQELEAGNLRPFVALEPCLPEGATCESGSDCCAGYCRETSRDSNGIPVLQCVPPPQSSCSNIDEVCITVADCCDPSLLCINSRCAIPTPIIK